MRSWFGVWAALAVAGVGQAAFAGVAIRGDDQAVLRLPASLWAPPYENAGYRLERARPSHVRVTVDASALRSRAWRAPRRAPDTAVGRLAHAIAGDGVGVYETVGRTLAWVSRNLRYELDRNAPQDARAVLDRRTAYCTGYARLSVALLGALGVEAREVAGWVPQAGFHRWIEVLYPDVGWAFSDPRAHHHFVPATYVRLGSEMVSSPWPVHQAADRILRRSNRLVHVAEITGTAAVVEVRPNDRPAASALAVAVDAGAAVEVALVGGGADRRQWATDGLVRFADLSAGSYVLRVAMGDQLLAERRVDIAPASESSVSISTAPVDRAQR